MDRFSLDQQTAEKVLQSLLQINQQNKTTLIVVTHDPELGERAARQLRFVDGELVHDERRQGVS